jgi:uncharacterized membrane protein
MKAREGQQCEEAYETAKDSLQPLVNLAIVQEVIMTKTKKWMLLGALVVSLFLVRTALAQTPSIDWWVISSGGGSGTASGTSLDGTIGQWVVGSGTSGTTQLGSGFWGGGGAEVAVGESQIFLPIILRQYP